jgi:hypothetical protein
MEFTGRRHVERVRLAQPLVARLGATPVVLVDISVFGARIEHSLPVSTGASVHLHFRWHEEEIALECTVVRSRLEHVESGDGALTVYHSGLRFTKMEPATRASLKAMLGSFIARALHEQKLNARGVLPEHPWEAMPVFHQGQLGATEAERAVFGAELPMMRIARKDRYVRYSLERNRWKMRRTSDPAQPEEGFTISVRESAPQAELLCDAYMRSDSDGRRLIRLFAELSIMEGGGIPPGRFEP